MSYLDHDGLAYFKSKLDRTFIADIEFDDGDIKLYGGDGTLLKTVVQESTVTQKKSTANKEYPVLLCWDADAEEDQTMKTVWYGLDARINPKFGYLYARRYYTEHPSYERTETPSARAEWHHIFTDAVSAPMGEVYEYLDRVADGGEHRMELRLYGNPLSQYVDTPNHNEATDAVSLGLGATRGEKLTFFGYAPSTPIYLEDGSTMRKSLARGDQYGKDIITRDWLNLNGSITGLVHTYMDETIDGYKAFLKTVTIDSGDDNNKAGLNVQGDVNINSGDNTKPSNLYVQGNSHIHGNEDIDGNLNVDGNTNTDGNITVGGNINKVSGNTTQEYVTYVTNQADTRKNIAAGLIDTTKGLAYNSSTGKISINAQSDGGLKFNSNTGALFVDFASATDDAKEAVLSALGIQIPLTNNKTFYVNKDSASATDTWRNSQGVIDKTVGTSAKPFKSIQAAVNCATAGYSIGGYTITIRIVKSSDAGYNEAVILPEFQHTTGYIKLISDNISSTSNYAVITSKQTNDHAARTSAQLIQCRGTGWIISHLKIDLQVSDPGDGVNHFSYCVTCSGGNLRIYACIFNASYTGSAPTSPSGQYLGVISATNNGRVTIEMAEDYQTSITVNKGNCTEARVFRGTFEGVITLGCTNDGNSNSAWHDIAVSGSCDAFIVLDAASAMYNIGGSLYYMHFSGTMTGKKCIVTGNSRIELHQACPGDVTGTYQSATYCYVTPAAMATDVS